MTVFFLFTGQEMVSLVTAYLSPILSYVMTEIYTRFPYARKIVKDSVLSEQEWKKRKKPRIHTGKSYKNTAK